MADIEKAIWWFESRIHDTPMPGSKRMYRIALDALREKQAREADRTQDVAPVWHGRWRIINTAIENAVCSRCRKHFQSYYEAYSYCPNCGARMDLEDEA